MKYKCYVVLSFFMLMMTTVSMKADAATPAQVKSVKVTEVKRFVKAAWSAGGETTNLSYECMELSWKKVKGASGYVIYRYGNASKRWFKIKTIKSGKKTNYILPEIFSNCNVKIKVVAYKKTANGKLFGKKSKVLRFTSQKKYQLNGIVKTKQYMVTLKTGWYRFASEEAFIIQNQYREEKNLKPMKWNEHIYNMTKIRAKECSEVFSYTRPNGKSSKTIVRDYMKKNNCPELARFKNTIRWRENISEYASTPLAVVADWKRTKDYDDNMLLANQKFGAISMYVDDGAEYWNSLLCSI